MIYIAVSTLYSGADWLTWLCLSKQTDKDFTVILLDVGNKASAEALGRIQNQVGVPIIHVPYYHPPGARQFDYAQWNTPFLFAESEDDFVFRFQSWRVIPSNFIAYHRQLGLTAGMQRYVVNRGPDFLDEFIYTTIQPKHERHPNPRYGLYACYGDWFMRVGDFLEVNGIDEPLTTMFHFEDMDFEQRWCIAAEKGLVKPGICSCGNLAYLSHQSRYAIQRKYGTEGLTNKAQVTLRRPCERCRGQWKELQASKDKNVALDSIRNNGGMVDLGRQFGKRWFYCRQCDSPMCHVGDPHFSAMTYGEEHRATIGLMKKWGRSLKKAREKALNLPLESRIKYASDSYGDAEILKVL